MGLEFFPGLFRLFLHKLGVVGHDFFDFFHGKIISNQPGLDFLVLQAFQRSEFTRDVDDSVMSEMYLYNRRVNIYLFYLACGYKIGKKALQTSTRPLKLVEMVF